MDPCLSQSSAGKCHCTIRLLSPIVATGECYMGCSLFNRLAGNHPTFFFTSRTSVNFNVVLVCEIIEKIYMGFKCAYLMIPL